MKKFIALILIVVLALAGISAAADDPSGDWFATEVTFEGTTLDPSAIGIEMKLVLNPDGTASMEAMGESQAGTWSMDGANVVLVLDGSSTTLGYDGTSLTIADESTSFTFQRTASKSFELPAEVAVLDVSAFDGTWIPYKFGYGEMFIDSELLTQFGLDTDTFSSLVFVIENGVLTLDGDDIPLQLTDGKLFIDLPTGNNSLVGSLSVKLLEGDLIMIETGSMPISIICARSEAIIERAA